MTTPRISLGEVPPQVSSETMAGVAVAVLIAALPLAAADVFIGPWDHDAGVFLLRGAYVAQGLRAYLDYTSIYPPLNDLITGCFVRLGLDRLLIAVALPILWILTNTAASAVLVWRATANRGYALIVGALFPLLAVQNSGNHLTLELPLSTFALLAVVPLLAPSSLTPSRVFWSAMALSATGLTKQNGAAILLPIAVIAWQRRGELSRRHWTMAAIGASALPLVVLAWLRFDVAMLVRSIIGGLGGYARSSPPGPAAWIHDPTRAPQTWWLFGIAMAAALLVVVKGGRARWIALAALLGGAAEFAPRLLRNYPHYNLATWPFVVIVLAVAGAALRGRLRDVVSAALLLFAPVAYLQLWCAARPSPSQLLTEFVPAAEIIATVTRSDEPVRQYGTEPVLEFLADRREETLRKPPSTQGVWEPIDDPSVPSRTTTVVVVNGSEPWRPAARARLEAQGFREAGRAGSVTVLRWRGH